jgi:lysozyme
MDFEKLMRQYEGAKTTVYLDSLGKPTVGIGHLVTPSDKLKVGDVITDAQVSQFFKADGAKAMAAAKSQASQAGISNSDFIVYLASVNFQLGTGWTSVFKNTWQLIVDGKYDDAVKEIGKSRWYQQTPTRAKDFQKMLQKLPAKKK